MLPRMSTAVTDEPEVTELTRFYLFFETRCHLWRRDSASGRLLCNDQIGRRFRITVEVSEQTYREHQARGYRLDTNDVTLPLDDHWWSDAPVPPYDSDINVRSTRGGYIDWWG